MLDSHDTPIARRGNAVLTRQMVGTLACFATFVYEVPVLDASRASLEQALLAAWAHSDPRHVAATLEVWGYAADCLDQIAMHREKRPAVQAVAQEWLPC